MCVILQRRIQGALAAGTASPSGLLPSECADAAAQLLGLAQAVHASGVLLEDFKDFIDASLASFLARSLFMSKTAAPSDQGMAFVASLLHSYVLFCLRNVAAAQLLAQTDNMLNGASFAARAQAVH
jgi:hypothetical protein